MTAVRRAQGTTFAVGSGAAIALSRVAPLPRDLTVTVGVTSGPDQ